MSVPTGCLHIKIHTVAEGDTSILHFACIILYSKIYPHPLWIVERFLCTTGFDQICQQAPVDKPQFFHNALWMGIP